MVSVKRGLGDRIVTKQARVLTSLLRPQGEPIQGLQAGQQVLFEISAKAEGRGCWLESQAREGVLLGCCAKSQRRNSTNDLDGRNGGGNTEDGTYERCHRLGSWRLEASQQSAKVMSGIILALPHQSRSGFVSHSVGLGFTQLLNLEQQCGLRFL